jgi:hypothetical protein
MAGRSPGHPRLYYDAAPKFVDAWDKPGHDEQVLMALLAN